MDHLGSREYGDGCALHWEVSSFKANNASCAVIYLKGGTHTHPSPTILYLKNVADFSAKVMKLGDMCATLPSILESTISVRYFYCPGANNMSELAKHAKPTYIKIK